MSITTIAQNAVNNSQKLFDDVVNDKAQAIVKVAGDSGLEGWLFDIPQEETLKLSKDITDHYTEDGSFLNDHRVIKPKTITLRGLVGELVDFYKDNSVLGKVEGFTGALANRLTTIEAYSFGYLSPQALQTARQIVAKAQYAAAQAKALEKRAENVMGFFKDQGETKTRQQKAYDDLLALFNTDQLLTIETPWGSMENMMIQELELTQGEESQDQSDITLTLKEVRITSVFTVNFNGDLFNRYEQQLAPKSDNGIQEGQTVNRSIAKEMTNTAGITKPGDGIPKK